MSVNFFSDLASRLVLLIPVAIGVIYALILNKLAIDKEAGDGKEVKRGVLLVFMGHIFVLGLSALSIRSNNLLHSAREAIKSYAAFIFLAQLVYVIPLLIVASFKGRSGIVKGALTTASLTFILSVVSCFGLGALK